MADEIVALKKEIEQLKEALKTQAMIKPRKKARFVEPPKPVKDLTVLEYLAWRLDEYNARLTKDDKVLVDPAQQAEYKRLIKREEQRFIEAFKETEKRDAKYAASFKDRYTKIMKKLNLEKAKERKKEKGD